jgi:hypothetical protein
MSSKDPTTLEDLASCSNYFWILCLFFSKTSEWQRFLGTQWLSVSCLYFLLLRFLLFSRVVSSIRVFSILLLLSHDACSPSHSPYSVVSRLSSFQSIVIYPSSITVSPVAPHFPSVHDFIFSYSLSPTFFSASYRSFPSLYVLQSRSKACAEICSNCSTQLSSSLKRMNSLRTFTLLFLAV